MSKLSIEKRARNKAIAIAFLDDPRSIKDMPTKYGITHREATYALEMYDLKMRVPAATYVQMAKDYCRQYAVAAITFSRWVGHSTNIIRRKKETMSLSTAVNILDIVTNSNKSTGTKTMAPELKKKFIRTSEIQGIMPPTPKAPVKENVYSSHDAFKISTVKKAKPRPKRHKWENWDLVKRIKRVEEFGITKLELSKIAGIKYKTFTGLISKGIVTPANEIKIEKMLQRLEEPTT